MKILLIGNSPLPNDNSKMRPAAGLRTWHFLKGLNLIDVSLEIAAVLVAMPECFAEQSDIKDCEESFLEFSGKKVRILTISKNNPNLSGILQKFHNDFEPDVIIGVNTFPSYMASRLITKAAFWADLNGWIMAEAQAQAYKMDSNDYLPHYWKMEKSVLAAADKISCVSLAQAKAIYGELAAIGRINKENFAYNFAEHIPNALEDFDNENLVNTSQKINPNIKEIFAKLPADSFNLLFIGGYNTWVDEETLFYGVEKAMKKFPNLYFISTGGAIAGLNNKSFAVFKEKIENSEFSSRFIFLGWVDSEDIPYIYSQGDAGINVDRMCMETLTGARNRINEMMKFSLPVITTLGSEIADEVVKAGAGLAVTSGNSEELGEAICKLVEMKKRLGGGTHENELQDLGNNGRKYILEKCNYEITLKPLVEWLKKPLMAGDKGKEINLSGGFLRSATRYLRKL